MAKDHIEKVSSILCHLDTDRTPLAREVIEQRARNLIADSQKLGIRVITPADKQWPSQLKNTSHLWIKGNLNLDKIATLEKSAAVVGSRAASRNGTNAAREIAGSLAEAGYTVISGGAFGIDTAAHLAAIEAGGKTIAVLPGGLDDPYPKFNRELFNRIIASGGALVSEVPIGTKLVKGNFLARNSIIAELAGCSIVVEAAARSGSLNEAGHALRFERKLFAAPGDFGRPDAAGSNRLIADGKATCLIDIKQITKKPR